jgi:hypothetical protein
MSNDTFMKMLEVHGTGRIIRKDGTVVNFTLKGTEDGIDISNCDEERDSGRSGHADRNNGDVGVPD